MKFIRIAAVFGAIAVILGAFGAHALKALLNADQLHTFETGVKYQFYHTLALLVCGLISDRIPSGKLNMAAASFIAGIIFFSGSLYLLSTKSIIGMESLSWLGPVTPIGGLMFITGWIFLFLGAMETKK